MAETRAGESHPASRPSDFRWQAFFQHAGDALFVLNRQRRVLFVNRAWEQLTGLPAAEARLIVCTRRRSATALARALCPPPEVLKGNSGRVRRLVPGAEAARRWWDIDFFPLRDATGFFGVLGKITAVTAETVSALPLPAELAAVLEAIAKKHNLDQLVGRVPAVRRAIEQADSILALRQRHRDSFEVSSLSSDVPALQRGVNQARLAAQSAVPVLIYGEPGTGKYWLARTIHSLGATREQQFARLDCARLPPAALAAAMFGDAGLLQRPGLGTLYLRDPAALPRELQARLSELLNDPTQVRPRIVAGVTTVPEDLVRLGRLLSELYIALATLPIRLPPLRERTADLPRLVERLLERVKAASTHAVTGFTPDAWEFLQRYRWPGNLRELYNVLEAACARAKHERIDTDDLPAYLRRAVVLDQTPGRSPERPLQLDKILEQVERRLMVHALRLADGNKTKAAELLSIWRPRLIRRMEALGIADNGEHNPG